MNCSTTAMLISALGFASGATRHADPCASTNTNIAADGVDDGGVHTSSAAYAIDGNTGGFAGAGDEVMTPGFVVSDEGPKTLLVRVVGPTLVLVEVYVVP